MSKYAYSGKDRDSPQPALPSPPEGRQVSDFSSLPSTHSPTGGGLPYYTRSPPPSSSVLSPDPSLSSRAPAHRSSTSSLTQQELDQKASEIIMNALERTSSASATDITPSRSSSSFSRKSLSAMMGGFSGLSLTRSNNDDDKRGRLTTQQQDFEKRRASSASARQIPEDASGLESSEPSRTRSVSPFRYRRSQVRDSSPTIEALRQSDVESESEAAPSHKAIRPRNSFSQAAGWDEDEMDEMDDSELSEESWSENDAFDPITQQNTVQNALIPAEPAEPDGIEAPDPLGEGVNIIIPPEPYFPTTLNTGHRNPRRRKTKTQVSLPVETSRPIFRRDRCSITLTQGDPTHALETNNRRSRVYVVASDLSEESRYAVEWGIGTVLKDGDRM